MKRKQHIGMGYLALAACLLLLPTYASTYKGATGKLLVANSGMPAPFNQTVIYIGRQTLNGAWGVIVNRPFAWKTGKKKIPAYFGGPVDCPPHVVGRKSDDIFQIMDGHEPAAADAAVHDKRVVMGCAGWGLLQLNFEMMRGAWDVVDYDPVLVFDTPVDKIWDNAHDRALQDRVTKQKNMADQYVQKK